MTEKEKNRSRPFLRDIAFIFIGAILSFGGTSAFTHFQNQTVRKALTSALYIDVRNKETSLYGFLSNLAYQKAINFKAIEFNIHSEVYDAFLPKILLLPEENMRTVIKFYGLLNNVNEATRVFAIEGINKEDVVRKLYDNIFECLITANKLIKAFEKEYSLSLQEIDREKLNELKKAASIANPETINRIERLKDKI